MNDKEKLFRLMEAVNPDFKKKLNEENEKLNSFVSSLPDNFPDLVRSYATDKNIGIDAAYYQFLGAFMEKLGIDIDDDELEDIETYMYGKYGDNKIEF